MLDKRRIQELLGSGLSNEVVANAVGCAPAYITQLMSDPDFATVVVELRSQSLTANTKRDRSIDNIEDKLIAKLNDVVDQDMIYKPREILQAFAVLNNAKRRGIPATQHTGQAQTMVQLVLPMKIVQKFTVSQNGEVLEVSQGEERQTLVTKPTHELLRELANTSDANAAAQYKEVSKYLPAAASEAS